MTIPLRFEYIIFLWEMRNYISMAVHVLGNGFLQELSWCKQILEKLVLKIVSDQAASREAVKSGSILLIPSVNCHLRRRVC